MSMERILYAGPRFCAVSEDGRLVEYIPAGSENAAGKIVYGKVDRMMPGLGAAFVDIGRKKEGFLPLKENSESFTDPPFRSGDRILVQIRREETGNKGAMLSRDLTIPGSYLLLMPKNRHLGISARLRDPDTRARLLQTARRLSEDRFGLVMRGASAEAGEEKLREELEQLLCRWRSIQAGEGISENPEEELLRDYGPRGIVRTEKVTELPADLLRQLKEAGHRQIRLPHGGNIVIDRCEAMTVIDINSASDSGDGNRRESVLRTNLEACRETAVQIRLRNLSGILILDLIDMDLEEDRILVQQALEEALRSDRIKTVVHGYTHLGLMEMTRKRSRDALKHFFTEEDEA